MDRLARDMISCIERSGSLPCIIYNIPHFFYSSTTSFSTCLPLFYSLCSFFILTYFQGSPAPIRFPAISTAIGIIGLLRSQRSPRFLLAISVIDYETSPMKLDSIHPISFRNPTQRINLQTSNTQKRYLHPPPEPHPASLSPPLAHQIRLHPLRRI